MIRCTSCGNPHEHFTHIDGVALICDDCVLAGELTCIGITEPEQPGITQIQARKQRIKTSFEKLHVFKAAA